MEARLRERLADLPAASGRARSAAQVVQVDDSYFRQLGATRALQIAGEHGWHLPEDTARYAPKWLVLRRRSVEGPEHQRQFVSPAPAPAPAPTPHPARQPSYQESGFPAPSAPIPVGRHSIAGEIGERIRLWGVGPQEVGLAWVVFEPGEGKRGDRSSPPPFSIHGGPDNGLLCSVRPTGPATYEVFAADGSPLARITRRPGRILLGPRRVRWTVQVAGTAQHVSGKVGTWYSWLVYYVAAPLWVLFWLCMVVYSLLSGDIDDMRVMGPSRTLWRLHGPGVVMEYRGLNKVYHLDPGHMDIRVVYAQAVLHSKDR
ncbi:hypothetical protein ACFYZ8_43705 [Streptomyces sp. NPDC001668]|uniref:hypothetical protein n=1 Tax=Streptomyces sp. NPDC001668 TaxID=3364598 RepID=UPI003676AB2A